MALFCNVKKEHVLQNMDASSLYEVPLLMEKEHLAEVVCECLKLPCLKPDLTDWEEMIKNLHESKRCVKVAIVGKYTALHDAYLSVAEALKHGAIANKVQVDIEWID